MNLHYQKLKLNSGDSVNENTYPNLNKISPLLWTLGMYTFI